LKYNEKNIKKKNNKRKENAMRRTKRPRPERRTMKWTTIIEITRTIRRTMRK
jgi:hypothetical protein